MNAHIIINPTNRTVSAGTLIRTAALGLALTNQLLSAAGKSVLPIDNAQLEQMILPVLPSVQHWPHGGRTTASPLRPSRLTTS